MTNRNKKSNTPTNMLYKDKTKDELIKELQERICWAEHELESLYQALKQRGTIK